MSEATYWEAYSREKSEILRQVAYIMDDKKALKFWEAYDKAKRDTLKMAANLSAHEKGQAVQRIHWDMINEARHNATPQGKQDTSYLSLDRPDEDGNHYDYGDCNRAMRRIFREIDEPINEYFRWLKIRRALYKLRRHPELQATLKAIFKYRFQPRQKIFSALKIRGETYEMRLSRVREILKILV